MHYLKNIFLKGVVGLTATLIMAATFSVQAAPTSDQARLTTNHQVLQSENLILAQKAEAQKEKQPSELAPQKEEKKLKTMGVPPCPEMERMEKGLGRDMPQKAGTKKLGGQAIRAKETPAENN